jgi:hypothetical protein
MRGVDAMQEGLFTVAELDDFVPADHPLRSIRVPLRTLDVTTQFISRVRTERINDPSTA